MPRQILHAHRDGWETALDHPHAVVVDYQDQMLRQGTSKMPVRGPKAFAILAFLLRSADLEQTRAAIAQAVHGTPCKSEWQVAQLIYAAEPYVRWLGMTVETIRGAGYRLHTNPRETLECCRTLAPGRQLPSRLKSTRAGHATPPTTCARSPRRSMTSTGR